MKDSKPETPVARKPSLKKFIIALILLGLLALLMYQTTESIGTILFVNRISEKQVVAYTYTKHNVPFVCNETIVSISGQRIVTLNISSQKQNYSLYSEDFNSSEIVGVSMLTVGGKEFPVLWSSEIDDGKEMIISGKFVDFYKIGTKESVSVLIVENSRESNVFDLAISANKLIFSQIAVAFVTLTATFIFAFVGVAIWFSIVLEEKKRE